VRKGNLAFKIKLIMLGLKEKYNKEVIPEMKEKFGYKSVMAVPKIEKVVVNTGFGKLIAGKTSSEQKQIRNTISSDLSVICGQRPYFIGSKKSISGFKVREGNLVAAAVTLRGSRMYDFLDRLIHIALPRSHDFRGLNPLSVDQGGNLTIGVKEHIMFPEIMPEKAKLSFGFEITVVTKAKTREEGLELLRLLGFPIKKQDLKK